MIHPIRRLPCLVVLLAATAVTAQEATHWSLQPVSRPKPPAVADAEWVRTPIDRFILGRLEREGIRPSPRAERVDLARRMGLVMHGLPPAHDDVTAFVHDGRGHAFDRVVDQALASPRYGERWARHWLDIVRFAETNGFETNLPREGAWPYRDWVIRAFNEDMPYDRFVTAQLAGDMHGDDAATGFLVAGPWDNVKSVIPEVSAAQRADELADMINVTSTAFLGMTVACARCHDHKFDQVTQKDYYAMQGTLAGVQHGQRPLRSRDEDGVKEKLEQVEARIKALTASLNAFPARGIPERTAVIIDEEAAQGPVSITALAKFTGHGDNPAGTARGRKSDPGDLQRAPNLSGRGYSVLDRMPNRDLLVYHPNVTGRHRIWISWGAGWHNHAQDAIYLLDADGDVKTTNDRIQLAVVDQRGFADGTLDIKDQALWSGLKDVGVHDLSSTSSIVLRSGPSTTSHVTADVVIVAPEAASSSAVAALRDPVRSDRNIEGFAPVRASALRFTAFATNTTYEPCIDELEAWTPATDVGSRNVALASAGAKATSSGNYANNPKHKLEHINDGQFGNPRSWISDTQGTGWVQVDFAEPTVIDRVAWGRDQTKKFSDRLATRYAIEVLTDAGWVQVASSFSRLPFGVDASAAPALRLGHLPADQGEEGLRLIAQRTAARADAARLRKRPQVYAGRFVQPEPTRFLHRGEVTAPKEEVTPNIPAVLGSLKLASDTPESARREALARAIVDKSNPLTARVMVNRIWLHHFGEGLVDTPSDFGRMGTQPSHPELLDWLAAEFMESGWSVKHIQRLILRSATWAQASTPRPKGLRVDADTRLLWRFPPRRLEAEAIRDAVLSVSGELDLKMGGRGFELFEPNGNYVRFYDPRKVFAKDGFRRMVYARVIRMEKDGTFGAFDAPDAGQSCAERTRSTTALQCLNLLNAPFMTRRADAFAKRVSKDVGAALPEQVRRAFVLAFLRAPSETELRGGVRLVTDHGLPALCRVLLNANEFLYLP